MTEPTQDEWETASSKSGLVCIGPANLFLTVSGPPRESSKTPVVIIEAGSGVSTASWVVVARQIATFARVFSYDRINIGQSDQYKPEVPRTAKSQMEDLSALLKATGVAPPYIIVGHSYAGLLMRQYIADYPGGVVGLVFVDCCTPESYTDRPIGNDQFLEVMGGKMDYWAVTGLETEHKFSPEEYAAVKEANKTNNEQLVDKESAAMLLEYKQTDKQVMGDRPVSVIFGNISRDMSRLSAEAERIKSGTEEQRKRFKEAEAVSHQIEEGLQRRLLKLSSRSRFVVAENSGHNVNLTEPELITKEVKWVWDELALKE